MAKSTDRPFVENYLAFLLAKTSHSISRGFHKQLKEKGISVSTWRILGALNDQERRVGELADIVLLNQPTLSKTLDKLVLDDLITRRRVEDNRRIVIVSITAKGRKLVRPLIKLANQHEKQAFSHLTTRQRKLLINLLQDTIQAQKSS